MFNKYPEGYDLTILDARYTYPRFNQETNKYTNGSMTLIARDNITGRKILEVIDNPTYTYYWIKDEAARQLRINYPVKEIPKKYTEAIEVPFKELEKDIASRIGELDYFYNNIKNKNRRANQLLHMINPQVLFSDMNIEDYYRFLFSKKFKNSIYKIDKAFLDIEVDAKLAKGDFPEPGECPINAITVIDSAHKLSYTFLLRSANNPQIAEFEQEVKAGNAVKELRELLEEHLGGWKNVHRYGLQDFKFNFAFYDLQDEIVLIADAFRLINTLKPDFVLAWNMAFDVPYIIARIAQLGYNPADIMGHPDFKEKEAIYVVDNRTELLAERGDFAKISSYSVFLDQMIQHASIRKGQSAYASYKLDYVAELLCGFGKLDYHHITPFISELPYKNFKIFTFYNIIDVIDQFCIEHKVNDIDFVFTKAIVNNTRFSKVHRQTVYLNNRRISEYWDQGYISGNNVNKGNAKPTEKFTGAYVASPLNIADDAKLKIFGVPVPIYDNGDDFDYKSLYPSLLREFNITDPTQIGKLIIPEQIYPRENLTGDPRVFDRGGSFFDDMVTHKPIEFCHRWFKLANFSEILEDISEYFNTIYPVSPIAANGLRNLYYKSEETIKPLREIYRFTDRNHELNTNNTSELPKHMVGELADVFNTNSGFKVIRDQFDSEDTED